MTKTRFFKPGRYHRSSLNLKPFKRQPHKMAKHSQTIRRQKLTNCLSVFDHFVKLALKGLTISFFQKKFLFSFPLPFFFFLSFWRRFFHCFFLLFSWLCRVSQPYLQIVLFL